MKNIKLNFPHQDDNLWLQIEADGHKAYQYPSPLEVKMLISEAIKQREEEIMQTAFRFDTEQFNSYDDYKDTIIKNTNR